MAHTHSLCDAAIKGLYFALLLLWFASPEYCPLPRPSTSHYHRNCGHHHRLRLRLRKPCVPSFLAITRLLLLRNFLASSKSLSFVEIVVPGGNFKRLLIILILKGNQNLFIIMKYLFKIKKTLSIFLLIFPTTTSIKTIIVIYF